MKKLQVHTATGDVEEYEFSHWQTQEELSIHGLDGELAAVYAPGEWRKAVVRND